MAQQEVVQDGPADAAALLRDSAPKRNAFTVLIGFFRKRPMGAVSGVIIVAFAGAALFAPFVTPYGPFERDLYGMLAAPSASHWFGTDALGRDSFTRVIYGARLSLFIGISISFSAAFLSMCIGTTSGYFGGWFDRIAVMIIDGIMAFPSLILAIALVSAMGQSVFSVILAVLAPGAAGQSRIVRTSVLAVAASPYVEAGKSIGSGSFRMLTRYIIPNVLAIIIVLLSLRLAGAMLVEGSLSFLGLGPPPPAPSWGRMLAEEGRQFFRSAPWLGIFPGLALSIAVFAFNLLGDGLRDHLDPRLRER